MKESASEPRMNIWLEISACANTGSRVNLDLSVVREISALSEALSAVQNLDSNRQTVVEWDYSSRIRQEESDKIRNAIEFAKVSEDTRSEIFSADVSYCDTCYSLRLFFEKSQ